MRSRKLVLTACLGLLAAACAAQAPPGSPAPPPTAEPVPATAEPVPATAEPVPDTPAPAPATPTAAPTTAGAASQSVSVFDFGFAPATLQIRVGTEVVWTNDGAVAHTVTFDDGPDSGTLEGGDEFRHTFEEAGAFDYICRFHPATMMATVTVSD